jgi:hypothetical protein
VEEIEDWRTVREVLQTTAMAAYTMRADESAMYLTPVGGGPTVRVSLTETEAGGIAESVYQALSATPAPVSAAMQQLNEAETSFPKEFNATVEEFAVVRNDRWTVWGQGDVDPEVRVFVAESAELGGLRGQYDAGPPRAGRVSDPQGRLYAEGPAWNWYLPGGSTAVASSRPQAETNSADPGAPVSRPSTHPVVGQPAVAPATIAAQPELLQQGLPHAMKWRADGTPAPLYKFSDKTPEEVFRDGLRPKGGRLGHLIEHVYHNPADTGYVSTSRNYHYLRDSALNDPGSADALHRRYRWRYDVVVPGGINVDATLDIASPFPDQEEVAFPGGINVKFIRGVQPLENGSPAGEYIVNFYYDPDYAPWADDSAENVDPSSQSS